MAELIVKFTSNLLEQARHTIAANALDAKESNAAFEAQAREALATRTATLVAADRSERKARAS
jgi:hypothetical protein